MTPNCPTCHHCHIVNMPNGVDTYRCFRIRTMVNKIGTEKGIIHPGVYGTSCVTERDSIREPHRVPGDKCGPTGIHWTEKS